METKIIQHDLVLQYNETYNDGLMGTIKILGKYIQFIGNHVYSVYFFNFFFVICILK
jgi:hypothetical protein